VIKIEKITLKKIYYPPHEREEVSFKTRQLESVAKYCEKGWTYKKRKGWFVLRAPEEWLVDLSDPYKTLYYGNHITNYAYFLFLKEVIANRSINPLFSEVIKKYGLDKFKAFLLNGKSLETEVRIAGIDNRISTFKDLLFTEVKNSADWHKYINRAKKEIGDITIFKPKRIKLENAEPLVQNFFFKTKSLYEKFRTFKYDIFNKKFIKDLFIAVPNFDVYVFIPESCFRYVFSFVNKSNIKKIMFLESHADSSDEQEGQSFSKNLKGKRVLVIDNAYTCNTLNKAAKIIRKYGGIPKKLALFPKSRLSVVRADYFLFNLRLFRRKDVNLKDKCLMENLYKESLKYKGL
jgi:hypothetical protein